MSNTASEQKKLALEKYQRLREEVDELYSKLSQVESDRNEHELVIESLSDLEGDRRCWHQVGAVLAEKKISHVVPILTMNKNQFADMVKQITESIELKQKDIAQLQGKHGLMIKRA